MSKKNLLFLICLLVIGLASYPATATAQTAEEHFKLGQAYYETMRMGAIILHKDGSRVVLDDVIKEFESAIKIKPDYAEAHCYLGEIYHATGNFEKAIAKYAKVLEIDPNYPRTRERLLEVKALLDVVNLPREAKDTFRRGFLQYTEGQSRGSLDLLYSARDSFNRVVEIAPDFEYTYFYLGKVYLILARDPKLLNILHANLGYENFFSGARALEKFIEMNPNIPLAHVYLGIAYNDIKRYKFKDPTLQKLQKSVKGYVYKDPTIPFHRAILLDPNWIDPHQELGNIYWDRAKPKEKGYEMYLTMAKEKYEIVLALAEKRGDKETAELMKKYIEKISKKLKKAQKKKEKEAGKTKKTK